MSLPVPRAEFLVMVLIAAWLPAVAFAALGEPETGIEAERAATGATHVVRRAALYTVHELTLQSGTTVREFASLDGTVFAVSWSGPFLPDLRALLGSHFGALTAANRTQPLNHSQLQLDEPAMVVHSEGRLRAFAGQAYLPGQLPAGVSVDELH